MNNYNAPRIPENSLYKVAHPGSLNSQTTYGRQPDSQTLQRGTLGDIQIGRRWGVVLAGGDGNRLRPLTRFIYNDDRPKQFCSLLGTSSLLREAGQRAERNIPPGQILYSLTRRHREYYLRDLADRACQRIIQPVNRGTAPAILSALLCISEAEPEAIVAILPCDHYYSDESRFNATLGSAFASVEEGVAPIVMLGAKPTGPETEYGWIGLGERLAGQRDDLFGVSGFQEKPPMPVSRHLFESGALWNTFVMIGRVNALLDLAAASVPELLHLLRRAGVRMNGDAELQVPDWVYHRIDVTDFSRHVLSPGARRLAAMALGEMDWNDLGDPDRVIATLRQSNAQPPPWLSKWCRDANVL